MTKTTKQPTTRTVARKLRTLAQKMRRVGFEMEYIGGFDDRMTANAKQLFSAARAVDQWAVLMANQEGGR